MDLDKSTINARTTNYFSGLCNVLPKGNNTSEKAMTSSIQEVCY